MVSRVILHLERRNLLRELRDYRERTQFVMITHNKVTTPSESARRPR